MEQEGRYIKRLILAARVTSMIFTPFYLPLISLIALFLFSYMSRLPLAYQLKVVTIVYVFTILLPTVLIHLYRRYQGWTSTEMGRKERRMVPYIIAIMCYFACYYLMIVMRIPQFMANIVVTALMIQVACAIINVWWKVSIHMAGIGGMTGALLKGSLTGRDGTYDIATTFSQGYSRGLHYRYDMWLLADFITF